MISYYRRLREGLPARFQALLFTQVLCLVVSSFFAANNILLLGQLSLSTSTSTSTLATSNCDYLVHSTTNSSTSDPSTSSNHTTASSHRHDDYLEWLLDPQHNLRNYYARQIPPPLFLEYKAGMGLGHQLLRMAAAYHLAALYGIPYLRPTTYKTCGGKIHTDELYDHLLGKGRMLPVVLGDNDSPWQPTANATISNHRNGNLNRTHPRMLPKGWPEMKRVDDHNWMGRGKRLAVIHNEVPGYRRTTYLTDDLRKHSFYGKPETDYQLYHQLMTLFERQHQLRIRAIRNEWGKQHGIDPAVRRHTVFGLHVRAGNGEQGDFAQKNRDVANLPEWLRNVGVLVCQHVQAKQHAPYFVDRPPVLYVGTDTGVVVDQLRSIMEELATHQNCSIPVVSTPQVYPPEGTSVSFAQNYAKREECLEAWETMVLDMYFFTKCDVILAGQYSSFTQAAPLSYIFQKAQIQQTRQQQQQQAQTIADPKCHSTSQFPSQAQLSHPHYFCEVGTDGSRMDCYDALEGFLDAQPTASFGNRTAPQQYHRALVAFPFDTQEMPHQVQDLRKKFERTAIVLQEE